jgi:hypothetical protein
MKMPFLGRVSRRMQYKSQPNSKKCQIALPISEFDMTLATDRFSRLLPVAKGRNRPIAASHLRLQNQGRFIFYVGGPDWQTSITLTATLGLSFLSKLSSSVLVIEVVPVVVFALPATSQLSKR